MQAQGDATVRLVLSKDEHKFSCAHITLFDDGTKERLHGHNFHVAVAIDLPAPGVRPMLDFACVKRALASLCQEIREHLLVPSASPRVRLTRSDQEQIEFEVCGKRYSMPAEDVLLLPVDNVVVETLAILLWGRVREALRAELGAAGALALELTVTESPGQGATYRSPLC